MPSLKDCIERNTQLKARKAAKAAEQAETGPFLSNGGMEPKDRVNISYWFSEIPAPSGCVKLNLILPADILDSIVENENHGGIGLSRDDLFPAIADFVRTL